uniref:KxYKxGKxW signal peptide domain-containing protein n=1 Tax=uncultured Streptococcus sp. TaxID=83427 RepID=UPI00259852BC
MENKVHFKLHKVKKQWVTIAVSGLALGASLIGVGVSANEQAANQVTSASTPESVSQNPDLVVTETTVDTTKADQVATNNAADTTATVTTEKQPVLKEDQASSTYNLSSGETRTATSTSETANTATDVNSQAPESVETTVVSGGQFNSDAEGNWYYLKDGKNLTGAQNVDHFDLYFHEDGKQAKGEIITENGQSFYYDKANGRKVTNTSININGQAYNADAQGRLTAVLPETNKRNQFIEDNNHNWYYLGKDGKPVTGAQNIDGFNLYFHEDGRQAKNEIVTINGDSYYFDKDNGRRVTGRQYLDFANHKYFGFYYFDKDGKMVKDDFITENGNLYYFDATGNQPNFVFVSDKAGNWYYINDFNKFGKTYQVKTQLAPELRENLNIIEQLYVTSGTGENVPLSAVADLRWTLGP